MNVPTFFQRDPRPLVALLLAILLGSCAAPAPEYQSSVASSEPVSGFATPPNERPGLGTKWGETRRSISGMTTFVRATPNEPLATAEIFYNDRAGIEAMVADAAFTRAWPIICGPAANLIEIGLRDENGHFLPGLAAMAAGLSSARQVGAIRFLCAIEAITGSKWFSPSMSSTCSTAAQLQCANAAMSSSRIAPSSSTAFAKAPTRWRLFASAR